MFQKYAGVQVSECGELPDGLETLIISAGQYAVFDYIGKLSEAKDTFKYIFFEWLLNSEFTFDNRPQIAHMGDLYKGECPDTEETFWFPIC